MRYISDPPPMTENHHFFVLEELVQNRVIGPGAICLSHKGGTESALLEIESGTQKIAVKFVSEIALERTLSFFLRYKDISLFPSVIYVGKKKNFYVYPFAEGEVCRRALEADEIVLVVDVVINSYVPSPQTIWGDLESPKSTFLDHLLAEAEDNKGRINQALGRLDEFEKIRDAATELFSAYSGKPYICHGDLGTHNMIMNAGKVVRIIDPLVICTLPTLELMFLILSKPPVIPLGEILHLCARVNTPSEFNEQELVLFYKTLLYTRIGRSLKYHPHDLPAYLHEYDTLPSFFGSK